MFNWGLLAPFRISCVGYSLVFLQVATPMDYFQFHSDADNEEVGHQIALPEVDHKCLVLPTDCGQLCCPGGEHA